MYQSINEIFRSIIYVVKWPVAFNAVFIAFCAWREFREATTFSEMTVPILYMLTAIFLMLLLIALILWGQSNYIW